MGFLSDVGDFAKDVTGISAAESIFGALSGDKAAEAAEAAARRQADAIRQSMAYITPFYNQGMQAQNQLMMLLGLGGDVGSPEYGSMSRDFSQADFQADPGYGFRMSEGLKALERSAAGRGGAASGAAMKGITRYGQDLASQEFQNAYNRYQTNRANRLNPLFNIASGGRSAAQSLAGGTRDVGEAQASGIVGAANARQGAINQLLNFGSNLGAAYLGGRGGFGGGDIYGTPSMGIYTDF